MGRGISQDPSCIDDWFLYKAASLSGVSSGLQRVRSGKADRNSLALVNGQPCRDLRGVCLHPCKTPCRKACTCSIAARAKKGLGRAA